MDIFGADEVEGTTTKIINVEMLKISMRIASFNVLAPMWTDSLTSGRPVTRAPRRRARIAAVLRKIDADILFMQEVTLPVRRLVKELGYRELVQRRTVSGAAPVTAIYVRRELDVTQIKKITCERVRGYAQPMVQCVIGGERWLLCGIHFEYDNMAVSKQQLAKTVTCVNRWKRACKAIAVAGDFNMESRRVVGELRRLGLVDVVRGRPTHPNTSEREMSITKILLSAPLAKNASSVRMLREPTLTRTVARLGSDHYPVYVDITKE